MDLHFLGWLTTLILFGGLGWLLSRRRRSPVGPVGWGLLTLAALIGSRIGIDSRLLSIFGFDIYLNWAISSFFVGVMVGSWRAGRRVRESA